MTIQEALAHVEHGQNRCQWTYELLAAMLDAQTQHPSAQDGTRISTTVLTKKCLRQLVFERQVDHAVDPAMLYAMFRGTLFHAQLEGWAHWENYAEARFYVADLGVQIPAVMDALPTENRSFSGSPDLVDPQRGVLYDYKRTKEVPRFGRVWPDHGAQLNINRWLVDNADTVEVAAVEGLEPDALALNGKAVYDLDRDDVRAYFVPVDWQDLVIVYADDLGPSRLSFTKSIQVPKKGSAGTKAARVPDIWSDEKVEAYIAEHYVTARRALLDGIAPIPEGWEYQSHALCVRCPQRRLCAENERAGR